MGVRTTVWLLLFAISGCSPPPTRSIELPSGKKIRVMALSEVTFPRDGPALILKYQTDLKVAEKKALRREVDEIWPLLKVDVEKRGLSNALISANEVPSGLIIRSASGYNFVFQKRADWNWHCLDDEKDKTRANP
jgi:hypothetical protein